MTALEPPSPVPELPGPGTPPPGPTGPGAHRPEPAHEVLPPQREPLEGPEPAAADGVAAAFAAFYQQSFTDMVRLAFLLTGSHETAADLVQDSFVRVQRRWRGIDEPRAYLRRAVVNACRSHHRKRARERERLPLVATAPAVDLAADELGDALAVLPYRQHAAIVLRYYHDLPEAAIADVLGCRPGTVASLLHRGLTQLRRVIEP